MAYLEYRNYGKIISVIGDYIKNHVKFRSHAMYRFPLITHLNFYLPHGTCTLKTVDTINHRVIPRNKVKLIKYLDIEILLVHTFKSI